MMIGLLFLFIPEIYCRRHFNDIEDLLDAFNYLINRLFIAWLTLCVWYIDKPFVTATEGQPQIELQEVSEVEQLLSGLHESVTSTFGLFGVCAAASVLSTSVWYVGYVFVHWSAPATTRHSTLETLHLSFLAATLQCLDERPVAQLIHYLVVKVVSFQTAWRMVKTFEPVLLERVTQSSPVRQMMVLIVFCGVAMEQRIISYIVDKTMRTNAMLTLWLTFPASLLTGLVAGLVTEYVMRIIAKRTTRLLGFAEDDVYLYALVEYCTLIVIARDTLKPQQAFYVENCRLVHSKILKIRFLYFSFGNAII